jgi:O-antigen ligase
MADRLTIRPLPFTTAYAGQIAIVGLVAAFGVAVSLLNWHSTLLVTIAAVSFALGAVRPDCALAALCLSVPLQQHLQVGLQAGSLTITKVILWCGAFGWAIALIQSRRRIEIDFVSWALFVLVASLILSYWNARDGGLWIGETYRWFATAVVATVSFNFFRRGGSPLPFLLSCALGTLLVVVIASWQVLHHIGPTSFESRGLIRAYGSFGHPNQLAIYLELTAPLFLALALSSRRAGQLGAWRQVSPSIKYLWYVALFAAVLGLLLSQSRGGTVGMVVGLGIVGLLSWPAFRSRIAPLAPSILIVLLTVLTIAVAIVAAGVETFGEDEVQVTPSNFAVRERLAHWTAAVEMAKDHPVTGVGAGNYDLNFRENTQDWRFRIGRGHAHNTYLHMLAQAGVIGLSTYLALLLGVCLIVSRSMRTLANDPDLALAIGAAGVTGAMLAHAVFEYVHVLSLSLNLAIVWGLASAISTRQQVETVEAKAAFGWAK